MDPLDIFVLVNLYYEDSSRSLNSYSRELQLITGTIVSVQTISRLFLHEFPYSARLRRPNVVPIDKFRPENMERAVEYISYVATIDPRRIKYGDEKHLKGRDVFNRNNRRNPFTGSASRFYYSSEVICYSSHDVFRDRIGSNIRY